jgi:hypothetical protein
MRISWRRVKVRPAPPQLPQRLRDHLLELLAHRVEPWLAALPKLVESYAEARDLSLTEFLDDGWSSYVAGGTCRRRSVVFEASPNRTRARAEIAGLLIRGGLGAPRVLECDMGRALC